MLVILSCIVFILFAIAKSIEINTTASIRTRGKAILYTIFSQYKLFVKTAVNMLVMFGAFLVVFLFISMIVQIVTKGSSASMVDVVKSAVMTSANLFLGIFGEASANISHLVIIPVFLLFFMLIFTKGMYRPGLYYLGGDSSTVDDTEDELADANRISNTMRHYIMMLVIALFFSATLWVLYLLLGGGNDTNNYLAQFQNKNTLDLTDIGAIAVKNGNVQKAISQAGNQLAAAVKNGNVQKAISQAGNQLAAAVKNGNVQKAVSQASDQLAAAVKNGNVQKAISQASDQLASAVKNGNVQKAISQASDQVADVVKNVKKSGLLGKVAGLAGKLSDKAKVGNAFTKGVEEFKASVPNTLAVSGIDPASGVGKNIGAAANNIANNVSKTVSSTLNK